MTGEFDNAAAGLPDLELSSSARARHLAMFAAMLPSTARREHRRRRVAVLVAAGFVSLAAGVGVAASFGAFDAPPSNRNTAHCYTTADLGRADNHTDFGVAVAPNDPDAVGDAAGQAMQICSSEWAVGRFSTLTPTFPAYASGSATHPVPPLTACVLDSGEVAIFPGPHQVCVALGLANASL